MKYHLLLAILTLSGFCYAAGADIKPTMMLDFGSADSPLYEGFTRVTDAGNDKVKWQSKTPLSVVVNKIERSGRPDVFRTELSCDYITGNGPAELKLSVPAGKYKVWLLLGHAGGIRAKVWNNRISTDTDSTQINIAGNFSGNFDMRYAVLNGTADKNGLTVRFDTANSWLINGLIVAPAEDWNQVAETVVAPIWQEYEFLPKDVAKKWKEVTSPILVQHPEPKWTEQQKKDGFAVFSRSMATPVWPQEFPAPFEIDAPVRAFVSQDEYETVSFSIHALKDFRNISLKVSDMVSAEGHKLPGGLQKDYIRYMRVRPHHNVVHSYFIGPDIVMPWQEQDLKKGHNLTIWLTVNIPYIVPPGDYKGTAELDLDGTIKQIPLTFKVLPIVLQKDLTKHLGLYYRHPYWQLEETTDDFSREWYLKKIEFEFADMQKTGFTHYPQMHLHGAWKDDRWIIDYDRMEQLLEIGRRYGMKGPVVFGFPFRQLYTKYMKEGQGEHLNNLKRIPPDEFFQELTALVRDVVEEGKSRNWPQIYFYPVDEPRPATLQVQFITRILMAIREGGGRSFIATEPSDAPIQALRPYLDLWCICSFSFPAEEIAELRAKYPNSEYWCYPNHVAGANDHIATLCARLTFGFAFWKSGLQGLFPWNYQDCYGDQWNFLDGFVADALNHNADDASVIPSANWIAIREGIDDGRYIHTLERWIETAWRHGYKEEAAAATADLVNWKNALPLLQTYHNADSWNPESIDVMRWQMAQWIMKLKKLTRKE